MDSMTEDIFPIDILDVMGYDWLPSISTMFCASSNGSSRSGGTIGVVANKGEKKFYMACSLGGAMSCGLTHMIVTPLDLVDPKIYSSLVNGWRTILKSEGPSGLFAGWGPTLTGYSIQGACKFGFYEYFKNFYGDMVGPEKSHSTPVYLAASASAEVIADVAFCPLEATKVRMQTGLAGKTGRETISSIYQAEGLSGLYKGIGPLWLRQVPYTMMKFAAFERSVQAIYTHFLVKKKDEYSKLQQLGVSFVGGYWAGIFCAVVSHPADTLVSKLNNVSSSVKGQGGGVVSIVKDLGFKGLWRGLGARILMIGTLTALQWFIYDTFKVYAGLPTTGAVSSAATHHESLKSTKDEINNVAKKGWW